jgi:protein-tyrosine phosphatase
MKILMVCLGNICRSPLAEGIMKTKLPENFVVDSAGTISMHEGEHPDKRAIKLRQTIILIFQTTIKTYYRKILKILIKSMYGCGCIGGCGFKTKNEEQRQKYPYF